MAQQFKRDRLPVNLLPEIGRRHQQVRGKCVRLLLDLSGRAAGIVKHRSLPAPKLGLQLPMAQIMTQLVGESEVDATRHDDILVVRDAPVPFLGTLGQHPIDPADARYSIGEIEIRLGPCFLPVLLTGRFSAFKLTLCRSACGREREHVAVPES